MGAEVMADSFQYGMVSARVGHFLSRLRLLLPGFHRIPVTRTGYGLFAPGDFLAYNDQRPRTEINEICGVEVSRTYHAYPTNALGQAQEIEERAAFPGAPYGHVSNPRTVKTYYAATASLPLPGRLATVVYPGGKTETCGYEYGAFNASTFVFTPDPDGGAWRETVTTEYADDGGAVSPKPPRVQAVRSVRVWDEKGREVLNESYVEDGASFALAGWTRLTYDRNGKLIETATSDGRIVSATWGANCCGKESETDYDGTMIVYGYNLLKQKISETKKGLAADGSGDIITLHAYDLDGRVASTIVANTASGLGYLAVSNLYNAVGRVTNHIDRLGNATRTSFASLATTVCLPSGMTRLTERYLDGQVKRILENGTVRYAYAYGVNPDGARWTLSTDGQLPAALQSSLELPSFSTLELLDFPWQIQATDPLGRSIATYKPGFGGTVLVASNAYDIAGNLLSTTQYASSLNPVNYVILSKNLYSYDAAGNLAFTAFDVNTNGVIDLSGTDRVTGSSVAYERDASNFWWLVSRSWVYPEFNSSAIVTTSVQRVQLTGLGAARGDGGVLVSHAETLDVRGNATVSEILVDRTARRVTQVTALPTSVQPQIQLNVNGLMLKTVSSTAVTNTFGYDLLGRRIADTDGRGNTTVTAYNPQGLVAYTEDAAANRTMYAYDFLGRRISVTDPLANATHTAYDAYGRVLATWGATYPAAYEYDASGRMIAMATTRDPGFDFSTVTNSSLFLPNSSVDVTRWLYDGATGLLTNKVFADGLGPIYTYTPDGKLSSRLWTRGVLTVYAYDAAGSLVSVAYSGDTPGTTYSVDRLGNTVSITDASGIHALANTPDGLPLSDALAFGGSVFTVAEKYDTFGQNEGYALSNLTAGAEAPLSETVKTYDSAGRLERVDVGGVGAFAYAWLLGSDLVASLAMPNGVTRETVYDPLRNLPASVTHTNAAGTVLVRRTFSYDAAGRLSGRTRYRLGDALNRADAFGYNVCSELTSAALGTNAYAYAYDQIGNRISATENTETAEYLANALNQYASISNFVSSVPSCAFIPEFDADGNQTLLKTTTGIWHVTYNAENRPVLFSNENSVVEMAYDHMGRRFEYKETVNDTLVRHERYLYRGLLQLAALDLLSETNVLYALVWDPKEPVATRPLALMSGPNRWCYGFDQTKNVTELFDASGAFAATYDYAPFGAVTAASGSAANLNPLTFSSEVADSSLGLVYYNYRHLNTLDGRWINRDPIGEKGFVSYQNKIIKSLKSISARFMLARIVRARDDYRAHLFRFPNSISQIDICGLEESDADPKKPPKNKCCNEANQQLADTVANAGATLPKIGTLVGAITSAKACLDAANGPCKSWGDDGGTKGKQAYADCISCVSALMSATGVLVNSGTTAAVFCADLNDTDPNDPTM
jgi:RHS repeat-associated protein